MESQQMAFRKIGLKEENYEEYGKDQPSKLLAQHELWCRGEQKREVNGTSEPYQDIIKGGRQSTLKGGNQATVNNNRIIEKNSVET